MILLLANNIKDLNIKNFVDDMSSTVLYFHMNSYIEGAIWVDWFGYFENDGIVWNPPLHCQEINFLGWQNGTIIETTGIWKFLLYMNIKCYLQ